jgi:hypothetical protein
MSTARLGALAVIIAVGMYVDVSTVTSAAALASQSAPAPRQTPLPNQLVTTYCLAAHSASNSWIWGWNYLNGYLFCIAGNNYSDEVGLFRETPQHSGKFIRRTRREGDLSPEEMVTLGVPKPTATALHTSVVQQLIAMWSIRAAIVMPMEAKPPGYKARFLPVVKQIARSGDYSLITYSLGQGGGTVLLKRKQRVWLLLARGCCVMSVDLMEALGIPSANATAIATQMPEPR